MDIDKDFIGENVMSGTRKIIEKQQVAIQQNQTHQKILKVEKYPNHHWDKWNQKKLKITVPSSKRDETSMSDLSKHSHKTDSIPRKKIKNNTWTFSQSS